MLFVCIAFLAFCLVVGLMPGEIVQLLLAASWAVMALMAVGATLYALIRLLF